MRNMFFLERNLFPLEKVRSELRNALYPRARAVAFSTAPSRGLGKGTFKTLEKDRMCSCRIHVVLLSLYLEVKIMNVIMLASV